MIFTHSLLEPPRAFDLLPSVRLLAYLMEPLLKEELERLRAENAQLKAMVVPPALSQAPAAPAPTLVERFDIEPYSDFSAK